MTDPALRGESHLAFGVVACGKGRFTERMAMAECNALLIVSPPKNPSLIGSKKKVLNKVLNIDLHQMKLARARIE